MMPLVFVHGVANRWSEQFAAATAARDALFRQFLLRNHKGAAGSEPSIRNPYWGGLGGRLRWGGASVPDGSYESLGPQDAEYAALYAAAVPAGAAPPPGESVLSVARVSLPDAVDLLWSAAGLNGPPEATDLAVLAEPVYRYASADPSPAWVHEVRDDREFVSRLAREVAASAPAPETRYESLGAAGNAWDAVRRGVTRLRSAATGAVGRNAAERVRSAAITPLAGFLGDVFVYLHQQEAVARPIAELVERDLRAAAAERTAEDPFVVVAHSMGGNIVYDLLTSTAADLHVDLLVTVGSQVGFFEELKLFRGSDAAIPGDDPERRLPVPPAVRRWINIFDYSDVLGFAAGGIFDGVTDYAYRTGSLLRSHSQYFLQPGLHERLAVRAREDAGT